MANDITLSGTLRTSATFDLPATRDFTSGSGSLSPATGTTLGILGNVTLTGLGITDTGTVSLQGTTRSVGALSFSSAATLNATGTVTGTGLTATFLTSGTATVNPALDLGTSTTDVTVDVGTGGTLMLASTLSKGSTTAGRIIKTGAGTLRLDGANTTLYGTTIGATAAVPTNGGTLEISTKDSLGTLGTTVSQARFNYGTLSATTPLTGASAIANGLSIGGRDASPAVFSGSAMEFSGAVSTFAGTGTSGDIRINVNNTTAFTGAVTAATVAISPTVTGLAVGGTGTLILSGNLTALTTDLKLRDTATVALNTGTLASASATAASLVTLDAGTRLAVGTVGTTTSVTAYTGLTGASTSVLHFDIGGTTAGTGFDKLILAKPTGTAGAITFAGRVAVGVINSFTFTVGDTFDLLDWDASVTPNFAGIDFSLLPSPGAGRGWDTSMFTTNGTLSIIATSVDFTITGQPQSQTVNPGTQVTFTVTAAGTGLTYQWRKGMTNISGATSASYFIASALEADEGSYFCDVTNASGTLASNAAVLTVNDPVMIITQPAPTTTVNEGTPVTFTVVASGTGLTYQWRKGTTNISGQIAASYTISSPVVANSGNYNVVVTGTVNAVTSNDAVLTVNEVIVPIAITTHPASATVFSGDPVTFTVVATGSSPTYQWRKGTTNIPGATAASYTINSTVGTDSGSYDVVVTGPGPSNSQTSNPATLTVTVITPGTNITGNQTYIENFNVMGTGTPSYPASWTGYKASGTGTLAAGTQVTSATSPAFTTSNGGSSTGTIFNYGTTSAVDRALGSQASAGFLGAFGASFTNSTGIELVGANVQIGFRSELWRTGTLSSTDTYIFEWKIGGNINDLTGWTQSSVYDITELNPTATTNIAVDGNATGNHVTLPLTTFSTLSGWSNGAVLHIRWRDVDNAGADAGMAIDDFQLTVSNVVPPAPITYWDKDGVTPGAGGATPTGTWGTDAFWGSMADGSVATSAWTAGNDAVFSAGTDAVGTFTVDVDGTQSVGAVVFEEGIITLNGGTLNFSDVAPNITVDSSAATIHSVLTGSSGLIKQGTGSLTLTNTNLFTGNVILGAGSLIIGSDSALGNVGNDLIANGTLVTTASLDLPVGRSLSGSPTLAPAAGTQLGIAGTVSTSGFTLGDVGSVNITAATAALGNLSFSAASTLTGVSLTAGDVTTTHVGGQSVVSGPLSLGSTSRNVTVSDATASLQFVSPVTLGGGGSNRLIKLGAGTLLLDGANTALNKVALGNQAAVPTTGGKLLISNKDALGITQMFFNYGTLEATSDLTGANAITLGLSVGGRSGSAAVLAGQPMTFTGATTLFGAAGTSGEIFMDVDNHTSLTGIFTTVAPSGALSGFTVGGTGTLSLAGDMTGFLASVRARNTLNIELDTPVIGTATVASGTIDLLTLDGGAGTSFVIGQEGTTRSVIAYAGLLMATGSELVFDIGGTTRGASTDGFDALLLTKANNTTNDIAGAVTFAGTVRVEFLSGFTPVLGQTFDLLDWDATAVTSFTGASFDLPALPTGLSWFTDNFSTDGTLSITSDQVTVTAQPQNKSGGPGFTATFSVTATGLGPLQYQWKKGTTTLQGQTARTLTITNAQLADEGSYTVVITGGGTNNTATSDPATLTITGPVRGVVASRTPTTEPVYVGDAVTFSAAVVGDAPFTYQWFKGSTPISLATDATLAFPSPTIADTGSYSVAVTSGATTVTSNAVALTVLSPTPNIIDEPDSGMLTLGAPMTLSVVATGRPPLRYQWRKNGVNITTATTANYTDTSLALTDYGIYSCVVSNGTGTGILTDTSVNAQIGVVNAQVKTLVLADKGTTIMTVSAAANSLSYSWRKNGALLPVNSRITGGSTSSLVITNLDTSDTAIYTCVMNSLAGSRTAGQHTLTVFDKAPIILTPVIFPAAIVSGQFDDPTVSGAPGFQIPVNPDTTRTPTSYSATGLPAGLKCDTKTGFISGKPLATKTGGFLVTMKAINVRGASTATATLNVTAFPTGVAGEYDGQVERSVALNTNMGGRIDLNISATGVFTGTLTLGSQTTYPLTGSLDIDVNGVLAPNGTITIIKNSLAKAVSPAIVVQFTADPANKRLTAGTITQGANSVAFSAWRNVWVAPTKVLANNPATAYEGRYNFGLELTTAPTPGSTVLPLGVGYAYFTVPKAGVFAIAGKTADNEAITCSTFLGPIGQVLMFKPLYTSTIKGSLLGTMAIETGTLVNDPADNLMSTLDTLTWNRPPYIGTSTTLAAARTYKDGFATESLTPVGGYYKPATGKVLFDADAPANARLLFTEGGDRATATRNPNINVTVGLLSKITLPLPANNLAKTTLTVAAATGIFSGTFELSDPNPRTIAPITPNPVVRSKVPYNGLIFRDGAMLRGYGLFMLPQLPSNSPSTLTTTSPIRSGQVVFETF